MHGEGVPGACPVIAAVGNPAQAVGGQGAAACGCARRPWTGRGCPRATGFRARTTYRVRSSGPQTRAKPRCERKKKRTVSETFNVSSHQNKLLFFRSHGRMIRLRAKKQGSFHGNRWQKKRFKKRNDAKTTNERIGCKTRPILASARIQPSRESADGQPHCGGQKALCIGRLTARSGRS